MEQCPAEAEALLVVLPSVDAGGQRQHEPADRLVVPRLAQASANPTARWAPGVAHRPTA
jgi:hypothetical protein